MGFCFITMICLFYGRPFDDGRMVWNSNDGFQIKIPDIYDGTF